MARSALVRGFQRLLKALDFLRLLLVNVLFVVGLVVLFLVLRRDMPAPMPDGGALVLAPQGVLVEQVQLDPLQRMLDGLSGAPMTETAIRDLVKAIEKAGSDDRVAVLVLDLADFTGGGLAKLQAVARALQTFRESGKPVLVHAPRYDQAAYYLASQADEVYLHPMGEVLIEGYAHYPLYFRSLIEKLKLDVHVFRVGRFKSAVEPLLRDDMSPQARQAAAGWLEDIWASYREGVSAARALTPAAIQAYADDLPALLRTTAGDAASLALEQGLVDGLMSREQFLDHVGQRTGMDEQGLPRGMTHREYLRGVGAAAPQPLGPAEIGVLVVAGTLIEGEPRPGMVSGEAMAERIRRIRLDDSVQALVLRIDSPGGSAYAAEQIRQELALLREAGKPVVVSMSGLAASGGYWIALAADQILASPATLTGSIGVFGVIPTLQQTLAEVGIYSDGIGTTTLAGGLQLSRDLSPAVADVVQQRVERIYQDFIGKVAEARGMDLASVDELAQGRVWSGEDALARGLVDALGDLPEAIVVAAELADLPAGWDYRYLLPEISFAEFLLLRAGGGALAPAALRYLPAPVRARLAAEPALQILLHGGDPNGAYALCACPPGA